MVYKIFKFKDGRTATLDWLEEDDLPELVDALNGVIREDKFLLVNTVITGMEEEREWFERSTKAGMHYLAARVDGKVVGVLVFTLSLANARTLPNSVFSYAMAIATWA